MTERPVRIDKKMTEQVAPKDAPVAPTQKETAKVEEKKAEEKKVESKKPAVEKKKVYIVEAWGRNVPVSLKQSMEICRFIKGKGFDKILSELEQVTKMRLIVPFTGEIPHRKGKGMMSGRYPQRTASFFIPIIKGLRGNAIAAGMDVDKARITYASPSFAARPAKSRNRFAKRINLLLKAEEPKNG